MCLRPQNAAKNSRLRFFAAQRSHSHLLEIYVFVSCRLYQYAAIIAWKCLLSISRLETSALCWVNINKVLLSTVSQHSQSRQLWHWFAGWNWKRTWGFLRKTRWREAPTFFLHASPEALLQPAVSALVALVFVHDALSVEPAEPADSALVCCTGARFLNRCPHLHEYMWFLRTLRLKKPLQPSQLEAP